MDINGHKWTKMDKNGQTWTKIDKIKKLSLNKLKRLFSNVCFCKVNTSTVVKVWKTRQLIDKPCFVHNFFTRKLQFALQILLVHSIIVQGDGKGTGGIFFEKAKSSNGHSAFPIIKFKRKRARARSIARAPTECQERFYILWKGTRCYYNVAVCCCFMYARGALQTFIGLALTAFKIQLPNYMERLSPDIDFL